MSELHRDLARALQSARARGATGTDLADAALSVMAPYLADRDARLAQTEEDHRAAVARLEADRDHARIQTAAVLVDMEHATRFAFPRGDGGPDVVVELGVNAAGVGRWHVHEDTPGAPVLSRHRWGSRRAAFAHARSLTRNTREGAPPEPPD